METIYFKGEPIHTYGMIPAVGTKAPCFNLVNKELKDIRCTDYEGKRVVLNIFPSLDTPVCAASVRRFNQEAAALDNTVVGDHKKCRATFGEGLAEFKADAAGCTGHYGYFSSQAFGRHTRCQGDMCVGGYKTQIFRLFIFSISRLICRGSSSLRCLWQAISLEYMRAMQ